MRLLRPIEPLGAVLRPVVAAALAGLPAHGAAQDEAAPACRDLLAVSAVEAVGSVCVAVASGTLTVTISATEGAHLLESRVASAATLEGFPLAESGVPRLGLFPHASTHLPPVVSTAYELTLGEDELATGTVLVAVHASVADAAGTEQGAWAAGTRFRNPGSPATYFEVRLTRASPLPGSEGP